jgi:site-specific recombinase XerD
VPPEPRPIHAKERVLSLEQARHLIGCTKENRKHIWQFRDHAILLLMLTTGMRSVEVRRAKKQDLRIVHGASLLYVQGKGRHAADAFVKLSFGVQQAIEDYLNKRTDRNPHLFISHSHRTKIPQLSRSFFHHMWKRILRECDCEEVGLSVHALRHTAATLNLQRGASLDATRRLLRHEDAKTTLIYAHHITRQHDDSERKIDDYIAGKAQADAKAHPASRKKQR